MANHIVFQLPLGSSLRSWKDLFRVLVLLVNFVLMLSKLLIMAGYFICESSLLSGEDLLMGNMGPFKPSFQVAPYFPIR